MTIFAIDPGPKNSALVVYDGAIQDHGYWDNYKLLTQLRIQAYCKTDVLIIEQIASFGMPVGAEVFETCVWSGRFIEAWVGEFENVPRAWGRLKRHEIKQTLCGSMKAKDPNIRQALIDRFGPGKEIAIGKKKKPGPLYGIAGDEWSALAVAIAWWERNHKDGATWKQQ